MKNVLIFGGTGFIGRNLCRYLLECGYAVKSFDNNERGHDNTDLPGSIEYIVGDICEYDQVIKAIEGADIVFNLAYINGTKNFYSIPDRILEIAAIGQLNVGKAINKIGVEKFIYASSSEAYQVPHNFPTPESESLKVPDPRNARFSYGGGKIFGELCTLHHVKNVTSKVIFRPHNIYGPEMGNDHVIPELFKKLQLLSETGHSTLDVIGSEHNTRSFMYIDDAVRAIKLIMERGGNEEIFHIGSGIETKISDLVASMISISKLHVNASYNADGHVGGVKRRLPDISKLLALGYQNSIDLDSGLARVWESIN